MSNTASGPEHEGPRRRRQPQVSCNFCRSKKLKCDRAQPCFNCTSRGIPCDGQSLPVPSKALDASGPGQVPSRFLVPLSVLINATDNPPQPRMCSRDYDAWRRPSLAHLPPRIPIPKIHRMIRRRAPLTDLCRASENAPRSWSSTRARAWSVPPRDVRRWGEGTSVPRCSWLMRLRE